MPDGDEPDADRAFLLHGSRPGLEQALAGATCRQVLEAWVLRQPAHGTVERQAAKSLKVLVAAAARWEPRPVEVPLGKQGVRWDEEPRRPDGAAGGMDLLALLDDLGVLAIHVVTTAHTQLRHPDVVESLVHSLEPPMSARELSAYRDPRRRGERLRVALTQACVAELDADVTLRAAVRARTDDIVALGLPMALSAFVARAADDLRLDRTSAVPDLVACAADASRVLAQAGLPPITAERLGQARDGLLARWHRTSRAVPLTHEQLVRLAVCTVDRAWYRVAYPDVVFLFEETVRRSLKDRVEQRAGRRDVSEGVGHTSWLGTAKLARELLDIELGAASPPDSWQRYINAILTPRWPRWEPPPVWLPTAGTASGPDQHAPSRGDAPRPLDLRPEDVRLAMALLGSSTAYHAACAAADALAPPSRFSHEVAAAVPLLLGIADEGLRLGSDESTLARARVWAGEHLAELLTTAVAQGLDVTTALAPALEHARLGQCTPLLVATVALAAAAAADPGAFDDDDEERDR